ncbi:dicarboxylate/amino acid:cation symporter [endosymbiont of Ridgeia piscesae]|jgi:DAACS family dicarboxylate/amino acid:cation (Na+ or H+) symporter|uniref:Dicarboxylate/amino acid:cation (Na+ or H+) symporter, DAACS family n=1 Tax=endosymbiont of Ridgeia piscesae TaxID=54398 RepID=A0A0T5ZB98_9GAMM|nr:dicarboxylate/amino acid:cation symporter [endosymbiont of Ridgeia piscesae]KRT55305.1 Na+/H+-dicarboxylate symporter [endosymbiont of Ridgeia piscesae]KRT60051.1 dicarboxylate/amino acid:cation (Na+ or H+) symporter, DAACS family [endosymbiont of Ridgeia piscesae]
MSHQKLHGLTRRIMIAMASGALLGILLNLLFGAEGLLKDYLTDGLLYVVGAIFVASLKMLVVPLVFVSLVGGVTSLGNLSALGRMSVKAILLYLFTTAVAISIALILATVVGPGQGFEAGVADVSFQGKEAPPISQVFISMVPTNPVAALSEGNMLQIIVFSLLFGIAITLAGERGRHVLNLFNDLDAVIMHMVEIIMRLAPYGVFALIARTFATQGLDLIVPLLAYFLTLTVALGLHAFVTYPLLLKLLAGLNPLRFLHKMRDPATFAFSTASSGATIPITMRTVEAKMGVDNSVASFTVPLGATLNMDGTAMMQGVATVFIANVYGVDLGVTEYLMVVLTATLASIGTAAVPGVGLVMLTMVLNQVGLPVEGIALIIGVDRLLDMMRTACNVTGDCAVSCIIAKGEGALDQACFDDPHAGSVETATSDLAGAVAQEKT